MILSVILFMHVLNLTIAKLSRITTLHFHIIFPLVKFVFPKGIKAHLRAWMYFNHNFQQIQLFIHQDNLLTIGIYILHDVCTSTIFYSSQRFVWLMENFITCDSFTFLPLTHYLMHILLSQLSFSEHLHLFLKAPLRNH